MEQAPEPTNTSQQGGVGVPLWSQDPAVNAVALVLLSQAQSLQTLQRSEDQESAGIVSSEAGASKSLSDSSTSTSPLMGPLAPLGLPLRASAITGTKCKSPGGK